MKLFYTACPQGLEWDGTVCGSSTMDDLSCSLWSLFKARYQTLMIMFIVSLVVTAISLVVKTRVDTRRWVPGYASKQVNEDCTIKRDRTTRQSLNRVEDLLDQS